MIYTRFWAPVNILNVRREMKKSPRGDEYEAIMVRLEYANDLPDGSAKAGDLLSDGQFVNAAELRADGGWDAIMDEVESVETVCGFTRSLGKEMAKHLA